MRQQVLLDTGPLVALIDRRDRYHPWATSEVATIQMPLLTCEAIISETYFLLQRANYGQEALVGLLKQKLIQVPFHFDVEGMRLVIC